MNYWQFNPLTQEYILFRVERGDLIDWEKPIAKLKPKTVELTSEEALNWFSTATSLDTLNYGEAQM